MKTENKKNDKIEEFLDDFSKNNNSAIDIYALYDVDNSVTITISSIFYDAFEEIIQSLIDDAKNFFKKVLKIDAKITKSFYYNRSIKSLRFIINIDLKEKGEEK